MRYASLKAGGYGSGVVEAANKVLAAHEAGRHALERRRRSKCPHPQSVDKVGSLRAGMAGNDWGCERQSGVECHRGLTAKIPIP